MNNSQKVHELGQALWYDNIERRLLQNGEIDRMIEQGLIYGITSNPSIFNNSIGKTEDYDTALYPLARAGLSAQEIYEALAVADIQAACDAFHAQYLASGGQDGYVSLEVNPFLANEVEATVAEAKRLWDLVGRPNLMVKIPATPAGVRAVRATIAAGINVNVTLIFSRQRYAEVMEAYLAGLEDCLAAGNKVASVASVASFFISRIDTRVDADLQAQVDGGEVAAGDLLGKVAIANARLAYRDFKNTFSGERFAGLKAEGGRAQRPLWASTSTKNPAYRKTIYVDELVGPDTVNTVPPDTLLAFNEHGRAEATVEIGLEEAEACMAALERRGISLDAVTDWLEKDGVAKFSQAHQELLNTIEQRKQAA